ncbi:uncharacterized protein LOC143011957 [Genypterus blacodes]|uniref:uncharacterized protein LOC143011957 n=1 Tax=Genypterus blacodes TaxID=154954 RepID=UPI003F761C6C
MAASVVLLYPLLGHLLISFCSGCVPHCLTCNITGEPDFCWLCSSNNNTECINVSRNPPRNCTKKDFQVSLNSTGNDLQEGDVLTLTCVLNLALPNLTFEWLKAGQTLKGQNTSALTCRVLTRDKGHYHCIVKSPCGSYKSVPLEVTVNSNSLLILLICGASAVVMVLVIGVGMKIKLKRDIDKQKKRREQRTRDQQRGPLPIPPREA